MPALPTVEQIVEKLSLVPHPAEGGHYRETYRSREIIPAGILPGYDEAARCCGTCIYYMLTPETFSAMRQVLSDEIFHFYLGDPVELLLLGPDGAGRMVTLGSDLLDGMRTQVLVPARVWQGARLREGGQYALMGCTVCPGFEFADYRHGSRTALCREWPAFAATIIDRTAPDQVD